MTPVDLLKQSMIVVCEESNEPAPSQSEIDQEMSDESIVRLAHVFAGMVIEAHTKESQIQLAAMAERVTKIQAERDGVIESILECVRKACGPRSSVEAAIVKQVAKPGWLKAAAANKRRSRS